MLLAPATPCTAPRIGQQTLVLDGQEVPLRPNVGVFTQPISFAGLPVVAVPVALPGSLPIGVQVIAAPWRETVALRVAAALERAGVAHALARSWRIELLEIDIPEVRAEVAAAFARYEQALVSNDVATLTELFWADPRTIRYGGGENLHGFAEIEAFRVARSPVGLGRTTERSVITTFGRDFATVCTLFRRDSAPGKIGRQMQTWVRFPQGWRVVAAHVSVIADAG